MLRFIRSVVVAGMLVSALLSQTSPATAATATPPSVVQIQSSSTSITIGVVNLAPDDPLQIVSAQYRKSGTTSWTAIGDFATETSISGLSASTVYELQADFTLASGATGWLPQENIYTSGLKAMQVTILDSGGKPVTGGNVAWSAVDGSYRSAQAYGLTANGLAEFPRVPASPIRIRYSGVKDSSGNFYIGTVVTSGASAVTVRLPASPATARYNIKLMLPNGLAVAGATVAVLGVSRVSYIDNVGQILSPFKAAEKLSCIRSTGEFDPGRCKLPTEYVGLIATSGVGEGLTDSTGQIQVSGRQYAGQASVKATYNDGVLIQSKTVPLTSTNLVVTFDEMPWLTLAEQEQFAKLGAVVSVPITFDDWPSAAPVSSFNVVAGVLENLRARLTRSKAGVMVSIVPPPGAAQKCAKKLSGTTNAAGKVVLKVCATRSGEYQIRGKGAVPTGSLTLLVKGAPPMPITAFSATLPKPGTAKLAWNPPVYAGGAPVKYEVVVSGGGHLVKKTITGRSLVVSGFASGEQIRADITPITKYGRGDVTQRVFFVA